MRARFAIAALAVWSAGASGKPDKPDKPGTPSKRAKQALEGVLCAARPRCSVVDVTDVGSGTSVVTIELADANAFGEMPGCATAEHWLVAGKDARSAQRQLLATGFSGECGAVGDISQVDGSAGTFAFEEYVGGGHQDHYDHSIVLSLSPLGLLSESGDDAERLPGTNATGYRWSWSSFSGSGDARYFRCNSAGEPLSDHEPTGPLARWTTLPALPDSVDGFPQLGSCSTFVDGDGVHAGYTIFGKQGSAADASFRATIAGRELLVEITDDHWTGPGKDPTYDDHLEIWLTHDASPRQLGTCEDLGAKDALQWGVRIVDGKVFAGFGKPTEGLHVRRSPGALADGVPAMLAIMLPDWFDTKRSGITVVYSDSDDGATQKRLIATSDLSYGKRWSLGRTREIASDEATCRVRAGKLQPVMNHTFTSEYPIAAWRN